MQWCSFRIGDHPTVGRANDQFVVSNIGMTKPRHRIVKASVFLLSYSLVLMLPFLLLDAVVLNGQSVPNETGVEAEIVRLGACHPTFKLSPPPVNVRVVWTQPFDIKSGPEGKDRVSIEFSIQYAQSAFFNTREEAAKAEDFTPNFDLRQRNHYAIEGDHLRLLWRESLVGSRWQRQTTNQPEFACWQTQPNLQR
jgi:hypothetical protein